MGYSSCSSSVLSGTVTTADITDFTSAVAAIVAVHAALRTDVHGTVSGTSKVAALHSPTGTAGNIYDAEVDTPPTPAFLGDLFVVHADGHFG